MATKATVTQPQVKTPVEKTEAKRLQKEDLVSKVAELTGQTKKLSGNMVDAVFDTVSGALSDGYAVPVHGFGTFSVKPRQVFEGFPGNGDRKVGTRQVVRFKVSKGIKERINS